jgi:hypothetical protein
MANWPIGSSSDALTRADSICRSLAAAADPAPLPNASTYRAWLSTLTTDAYCHVQGLSGRRTEGCGGGPLPGAGPWFLADGVTGFAGSLDQLLDDEEIYLSASRDENFAPIPTTAGGRIYWTGTGITGESDTFNCGNWGTTSSNDNGLSGDAHATTADWTRSVAPSCSSTARLLCLEPGPGEPSKPEWSPGALVFTTSETGRGAMSDWPESDGLAGLDGADRICRNLAAAANLPSPDSFVAWLSTIAIDARDRLTTDGPFRRVDGFLVADDLDDLVDGGIDASLHVIEDGTYLGVTSPVWTGTSSDGTMAANRCDDWLSQSFTTNGLQGRVEQATLPAWTSSANNACGGLARLYCVSNVVAIFWDGFDLTGDASRWTEGVR